MIIMAKKTTAKTASKSSDSDDVLAVVAYLTIIGWLIAFLLNREKNNALVRYHEKQALMVNLVWLVVSFIVWFPIIGQLLWLAVLVLAIIGLINALNKKQVPVPIIGKLAEEHFKW